MKINDNSGKPSKGYTIYWDKIFIAAAIFSVVIIGAVCLVLFLTSGTQEESKPPAEKSEKSFEGQSFAADPPDEKPEEDKSLTMKVVIDAGHGGEDGGSTDLSGERIEKDDNLNIALAVKSELEKQGVEVVLTREGDTFVSLDDRCDIANKSKADLFVSLHRNSAAEGNGVEIWVSKKKPVPDTKLGQNIMDALEEAGISENRGVQFGYIGNPNYEYQVNMDTEMPSCLVELGFMTSDADNQLFDDNFNSYAKAIAGAVIKTGNELGLYK